MSFSLDANRWAEQQFSGCDLSDKRRTQRLIKVAKYVANNPSASIPNQMERWSDVKAAYRLFDCEDVTFESIAKPHWEQTRKRASGRSLIVDDTTELNFGSEHDIEGLSDVGNGSGRGFLLHNGLMVDAATKEILGVAGQTIHYRKSAPKKETTSQRFKRERESKVWGDVIDQIGEASEGVQYVHVCDRGADDFEVYCHLLENRCDWVVRASSLHRHIVAPDKETTPLSDYLTTLPVAGSYQLKLRARPGQAARTAALEVRFGKIWIPTPKHRTPYVKQKNPEPIEMNVVWVREVDPPKNASPIEWVLYTSLSVETFDDAWTVIDYYETRWLVEEYHKGLKTGCRVTDRVLRTAGRLEAITGLMSVVAVRLIQLKSVARTDPDRPARRVVPPLWLKMLQAARKNLRRVHDLTVYQFYRELAKLGGFLGRRHDGEPGWITIWRGWEKLNALVRGAKLAIERKICG